MCSSRPGLWLTMRCNSTKVVMWTPSISSTRSPGISLPSAAWPGSTTPTVGGEKVDSPASTPTYSNTGKRMLIAGPANTMMARLYNG